MADRIRRPVDNANVATAAARQDPSRLAPIPGDSPAEIREYILQQLDKGVKPDDITAALTTYSAEPELQDLRAQAEADAFAAMPFAPLPGAKKTQFLDTDDGFGLTLKFPGARS